MLNDAEIEEMPIKTSDQMEIKALLKLRDAICYASVRPDGYCLCDQEQRKNGHAIECRDLREALRCAGVDPGSPE